MADKLVQWGCENSHWWPLVPRPHEEFELDESFLTDRDIDICYVGGAYGDKVDRLHVLRKRFGNRLRIHGRWPVKGWFGMVRMLYGKPALITRVTPLSMEQRRDLYLRTRIGLNMHLSRSPRETGNMRMYEIPAHGMMQVCDVAGLDAQERIFEAGKEAVYYRDLDEAISLIEHYLAHDDERVAIARAGYQRVRREYRWDICMRQMLDWAAGLRGTKSA